MNYLHWLKARKNIKFFYYLSSYCGLLIPRSVYRSGLRRWLDRYDGSEEKEYLEERLHYYHKRVEPTRLSEEGTRIGGLSLRNAKQKTYVFDTIEVARYFPLSMRLEWLFGDITEVPDRPTVVKSRPIEGDNRNSVLLNLDKQRHFVFVDDPYRFEQKVDKVVFRGKVPGKRSRECFMEMYFDHRMCDLADVSRPGKCRPEWQKGKMTLLEHLRFKFVLALEGNDVASNLKWVMSSNSIAVMPRPTYETWFMEGRLVADVHYIEIRPDFADLEERLTYYIDHPDEAQRIVDNAHRYVEQFMNPRRERLLSIMVLKRYFEMTGQRHADDAD